MYHTYYRSRSKQTLVDCGSTDNFINLKLVKNLKLETFEKQVCFPRRTQQPRQQERLGPSHDPRIQLLTTVIKLGQVGQEREQVGGSLGCPLPTFLLCLLLQCSI